MAGIQLAEMGLTHMFQEVSAPVQAVTPPEYQFGIGVMVFGLFAVLLRV